MTSKNVKDQISEAGTKITLCIVVWAHWGWAGIGVYLLANVALYALVVATLAIERLNKEAS